MKLMFYVSIIVLVCSCEEPISDLDKYSNFAIERYAVKMRAEGLRTVGFGGGAPGGKVTVTNVSLLINNSLDLIEARKLIVHCGNALLKILNEDEKLRPYLVEYPVKPTQISLIIGVDDDHEKTSEINTIILVNGNIIYYRHNGNEYDYLQEVCRETYAEAENILMIAKP